MNLARTSLWKAAAAVVLLAAAAAAPAAEPFLEKADLFEAGKDGYALYRIPGLVVTTKGTLLAYCEARKTGKSDWDTIDLLLRRSTDGDRTWSERQQLAQVDGPHQKNPVALAQKLASPDDVTYNNPVGIVDRKTSADTLLADAQAWAAELSKGSATALALGKTILDQSYELSAQQVFAQGSQAQGICYTSTEHRESVMAFLAKTAPKE